MRLKKRTPTQINARLSRYGRAPYLDPYGYACEVLRLARVRSVHEVWTDLRQRHREAMTRARDHQPIDRELAELAEFAWLLGQEGPYRELRYRPNQTNPFGALALRRFAEAMRLPFPTEGQDYLMWRMGQGWPCVPECDRGCRAGRSRNEVWL